MLQVIVNTKEQMKTLLSQILFRPADETDGSEFEAELTPSEVQTFLLVNDDVLVAWMKANGLGPEDEDDEEFELDLDSDIDFLDVCDLETLKRYAIDEGNTPLLAYFQPGLVVWEIEDHYDRMGGDTSRVFQFIPLAELSFDAHMEWYNQMQKDFKESNDLRDRVAKLENDNG
mgnify:CR=1 FL=1